MKHSACILHIKLTTKKKTMPNISMFIQTLKAESRHNTFLQKRFGMSLLSKQSCLVYKTSVPIAVTFVLKKQLAEILRK